MLRALFRAVLILVIVVGIAAFFMGYQFGEPDAPRVERDPAIGTSGATTDAPGVSVGAARDTGAEIGERVATGANAAGQVLSNAALTAKIKSKMALDDTIRAAAIDIDTTGTVVTLRGTVASAAERQRAVALARETDGVSSVVDQLQIR